MYFFTSMVTSWHVLRKTCLFGKHKNRIQFVQVNYKRRLFRHRQAFEDPLWSTLSSVGTHSQFAVMNQCSHTSVTKLLVWSVWCTACVLYSQMDSEGTFSRAKFDFTFGNNEVFFSSVECCSEILSIKDWPEHTGWKNGLYSILFPIHFW